MKRVVSAMLSIVLMISLTACGGKTDNNIEAEIQNALEGEITGEITVSCYDTMFYEKFLNEAAALFEKKYPDTKINIDTFSKMPEIKTTTLEDGSTVSVVENDDDSSAVMDYISRINTELMGGQGPDVLAVDVLPYYKYAQSGMFADLRIYMDADKDFDINEYRSNIIEGTKYNGGQYIMPLDFGFNFISFDKSRVDDEAVLKLREKNKFTYWELTDLIKEQFANDAGDARVVDFQNGASQAFRTLFNSDYKKYIDLENKKANFKNGDFVQLLNKIKEQRDKGYFRPSFSSTEEQTKDFVESQRLYYYQYQIDMVLKNIFYPREDVSHSEAFPTPGVDEIAGLLTNDAGEATLRCFQAYGMNANSQNKKLAWEFIKFMLGEEMQQSFNLLGFPVNNAAFIEDSKMYLIKMPNYVPNSETDGEYSVDGYQELTEEKYVTAYENYIEYLNGFVNDLSLYPVTDKIINDMVANETALFFDGSRSAEEVADALQNKVQLYLDE